MPKSWAASRPSAKLTSAEAAPRPTTSRPPRRAERCATRPFTAPTRNSATSVSVPETASAASACGQTNGTSGTSDAAANATPITNPSPPPPPAPPPGGPAALVRPKPQLEAGERREQEVVAPRDPARALDGVAASEPARRERGDQLGDLLARVLADLAPLARQLGLVHLALRPPPEKGPDAHRKDPGDRRHRP